MSGCVIGLDASSKTGYAIIDKESGDIIVSGTQVFKGKADQRFYEFNQWLDKTLQQYAPDLIIYEEPHFRGYAATMSGVGLIALIKRLSYATGIPNIGVHTATLKKFATGYGKANKQAMTNAANIKENLQLKSKDNNDEADAIHLALYGIYGQH